MDEEHATTDPTNPPREIQLEDGRSLFEWFIEMGVELDAKKLDAARSRLSNEPVSIAFEASTGSALTMRVTRTSGVTHSVSWYTSIRALLVLEREIGTIKRIQGSERDEWGLYFAAVEHVGFIDKDKTELMLASERGDIQGVLSALESDADLNDRSLSGGTAIGYAASAGHVDIVRELIKRGADLNISGGEFTPLQASVAGGPEAVKVLLDAGADVNLPNRYGNTALMNAAVFGNPTIVKILLDRRADPNIRDWKGRTALSRLVIVAGPYVEIANLLRQAGAR